MVVAGVECGGAGAGAAAEHLVAGEERLEEVGLVHGAVEQGDGGRRRAGATVVHCHVDALLPGRAEGRVGEYQRVSRLQQRVDGNDARQLQQRVLGGGDVEAAQVQAVAVGAYVAYGGAVGHGVGEPDQGPFASPALLAGRVGEHHLPEGRVDAVRSVAHLVLLGQGRVF